MKIAICAKNNLGLNSEVDQRFGRSEYFVIFDTENEHTTVLKNGAKSEISGAGGKSVSLLHHTGADVLIVPELGPKAVDAINAFELEAYQIGEGKIVQEVLDAQFAGELQKIETASVKSHNGLRKA